jgi:hypothetical protein
MYWMTCGMNFTQRFPDATDEIQAGFIAGAGTRAPAPPAVEVTIDDTDSAAFEDGDTTDEIARVIREAARMIEHGSDEGPLWDINGNTVGSFRMRY